MKVAVICMVLLAAVSLLDAKPRTRKPKKGPKNGLQDDVVIKGVCQLMNFGPFGGTSGSYFTDKSAFISSGNSKITLISMCYDNIKFISLRIRYGSVLGALHGLRTGTCRDFPLASDEVLIGAEGAIDIVTLPSNRNVKMITELALITNKRTIGPFGRHTDDVWGFRVDDKQVSYIAGYSGAYIDQLVFYAQC